jgi:hypothetical protein
MPIVPAPGIVLTINSGNSPEDELIRLGSALLDEPNLANHIAVLIRQDAKGTWWALEGRPGGVGWADATRYLNNKLTISNQHQPLTDLQRTGPSGICNWMERLINSSYDWDAIVGDGFRDLHLPVLPDPWTEKVGKNGLVAGHVVCSSAAIFAYVMAKAAHPEYTDAAHEEPSDWVKFILANSYQ